MLNFVKYSSIASLFIYSSYNFTTNLNENYKIEILYNKKSHMLQDILQNIESLKS